MVDLPGVGMGMCWMPRGVMIKHGIFEALDPGFEYNLAKIVLWEL